MSTPIGATTSSNSASKTTTTAKSNKLALKTEDFIKMMVTQLQQQDPMEPAKNEQLLAQMSQIGQLQSATDLQTSLKGMVQQNQVGAAANLIGKSIAGMDANNNTIKGQVTSVRVTSDGVNLELDSGQTLDMSRVTTIGSSGSTAAKAN